MTVDNIELIKNFNKSLNKPRKIGGLYSIDVGQSKDPFNRRY